MVDKFEEYKLFVEDTAKFSSRRQQISVTYLTVNSIIISGVSFVMKDLPSSAFWRSLAVMLVLGIGILICLLWKDLIYKYKLLVNLRIDELRALENHADLSGCHKMYHQEDKLYPRDAHGKPIQGEALNISDKEKLLPLVFIVAYAAFFLGQLFFLFTKYTPAATCVVTGG